MRKLNVALSLVVLTVLTMPQITRPGLALTSAEAVDQSSAYPNVGSIMVWRDPNNPLGLPGGLAGQVTAVLIHPQTLLTAGHFAARAERELPPWVRIVVSFAPNALASSTWIDLNHAVGTCIAHPSFPRPCTPQSCPFDDADGLYEPGISDVGLCFLDEPVVGIRHAKLANRSLDDRRYPGHEDDHRRVRNDGAISGRCERHVALRWHPPMGHFHGRSGHRPELGNVQPRPGWRLLRGLGRTDLLRRPSGRGRFGWRPRLRVCRQSRPSGQQGSAQLDQVADRSAFRVLNVGRHVDRLRRAVREARKLGQDTLEERSECSLTGAFTLASC